ncbi:MAG: hypothetical protein GY909_17980 [Oligoflexia bacterium]|nr:hypothetical protein [Oligoflexia bacterium]
MKQILLIFLGCTLIAIGYYAGIQSSSKEDTVLEIVNENSAVHSINLEKDFYEDNVDKNDIKEIKASKQSQRNLRKKMVKQFKYLMNHLPYSFVKRTYQKKSGDIEKAAFGDFESSEKFKDNDLRVQFQKEAYKEIVPFIKKSFYYYASGLLRYRGREVPYSIAMSFHNPWPQKNIDMEPTIHEDPQNFSYFTAIQFDNSRKGSDEKSFVLGMGAGMWMVKREGNKVFLNNPVYHHPNKTLFDHILHIMIEIPQSSQAGSLRLFDTMKNEWIYVQDNIEWQKISKEEYDKERKRILDLYEEK